MSIIRKVITEVYCDVCGEQLAGWESARTGVSKERAACFAREEGCTVGKKIICKSCRIGRRIEKCGLQKKCGYAGRDGSGACLGFGKPFDDEPIERCKRCIACTSYNWEENE